MKVLITECIRPEDKLKLKAIENSTFNIKKLDDLIIDFFNDFERIKEIKIYNGDRNYENNDLQDNEDKFILHIHASPHLAKDQEFTDFVKKLDKECKRLQVIVSSHTEFNFTESDQMKHKIHQI